MAPKTKSFKNSRNMAAIKGPQLCYPVLGAMMKQTYRQTLKSWGSCLVGVLGAAEFLDMCLRGLIICCVGSLLSLLARC